MRVLLVEDTISHGEATVKLLAGAGHEVEWVYDATHAIGKLNGRPFDVMILDMVLAGSNGFRVLRDAERLPPRVVITTGMVPAELAHLPDDLPTKLSVLYKPIEFDDLLAAVVGGT